MSLKGKTAIVTGSNSGIGLGVARELAKAGANVVLNSFTDREEDHALAKEIADEVQSLIESIAKRPSLDQLQQVTRQGARKVIREHSQRKPVVIPAILEV